MRENQLREIFAKTNGHCHFCGDRVQFEKRGYPKSGGLKGYWQVDHVIQLDKGGKKSADNCLPCCTMCNRLRWSRRGVKLRKLIFLGIIAHEQLKKKSKIGKQILELKRKRKRINKGRQKKQS